MTVYCITQARMGSSRLPDKVLKPINGIPLIEYHLSRLDNSQLIDHHILATSNNLVDQKLVDYCKMNNRAYFCGDEHDVLGRFYNAAISVRAKPNDIIIRLTGDCPLICSELIDEAVLSHQSDSSYGYTHISLDFFPRGFDVEVFSMDVLTQAYEQASLAAEREHVTLYIYSHADIYPINVIRTGSTQWASYRVCVDEDDDFIMVSALIERLGVDWVHAKAEDICAILEANKYLVQINKSVQQMTPHK